MARNNTGETAGNKAGLGDKGKITEFFMLESYYLRIRHRGSSQPRDQTQVSCIADRFFTIRITGEAHEYWSG